MDSQPKAAAGNGSVLRLRPGKAFALHYAVRRAGLPFLGEVILLAVVFAGLKPILRPRPWLFSNLFFCDRALYFVPDQEDGTACLRIRSADIACPICTNNSSMVSRRSYFLS
jgi:hypothetical protein